VFVVGWLLLLLSCTKWDVGQFLFHPSIARRMQDNLSGELTVPAAPEVNPDSFRFALFGDPQIGEDLLSQLGHFRHEVTTRGIEFFGVLGDLTNDALPVEQQALKAALDSTAVPYYCTLGNHDLYQADGWDWFKQNFGPSCYALEIGGKVRILFLDTAEGALGLEQFDWLERELADSAGLQTIVATHYPVYDGIRPIMYRLSSSAEQYKLLSLLARYHVRYFVAGHIHGWRYFRIDELNHLVCSLPPGVMDYGKPGCLVFTWAHDSLSWEHVEFDSIPTLP
jgi:3',5'-cyclic AMP phosphodiesterase CpdA